MTSFKSFEFPRELKELNIFTLADLHWGSPLCDVDKFRSFVRMIQQHPEYRVVGLGDLINCNLKTSVGSVYEDTMPPSEQIKTIIRELQPIKHQIMVCVGGNHPHRAKKEVDIDPAEIIAEALNIPYDPLSIAFKVRFGKDKVHHNWISYMFLLHHGDGLGGGKKPGAAQNNIIDFAKSHENIDIVVCGHTHQTFAIPIITTRYDTQNNCAVEVKKLCVVAPSFQSYGGYAQQKMYNPSVTGAAQIVLSGTTKDFKAII